MEYGTLLRTLHALRWFTHEAFRRRIGRQLNPGRGTNDLRRFTSSPTGGRPLWFNLFSTNSFPIGGG